MKTLVSIPFCMKKLVGALIVAGLIVASCGLALASGFYAATDQLGYQGTIWNITDSTGPWTTSTPRDAVLYTIVNAPQIDLDANYLLSNWYEHSVSNQDDSFFQLAEDPPLASVTSADGFWSNDLKTFNMTVTGSNLPYSTGSSRFWQPDNLVASPVTFTNYSYTFTATFPTAATLDGFGFYVNSNPDTIVGSFTGQFVVTGDTYGFDINLSKALLAPLDAYNAFGDPVVPGSDFGSTEVPEPTSLLLLSTGMAGIGLAVWRRRK